MPQSVAKSPAKPRLTMVALQEQLTDQKMQNVQLAEDMGLLELALEDRAYSRVGNQYTAHGMKLTTIKAVAEELRTHIIGGGMVKRIAELRGNAIYGDGVGFAGFKKAKAAFESQNNIDKIFSVPALQQINRAHATDGNIVFIVHKVTKEIIRWGVEQMGQPFLDADDNERTWYVRRNYTQYSHDKPAGQFVTKYYATDVCPAVYANIPFVTEASGVKVPVDTNYTAVVWDVNRQLGWPLGIPDLLASLQWVEKYGSYLKNQERFAEALATLAWQYKAANTDQAKKMSAAIAGAAGTAGGATVSTDGMDVKPLPGGSTVSFENGRPLAAQAAAAGEVPIESLLADGQFAAAAEMDPDFKAMAGARRLSATAFFKRIGKLLGAPNLEVIWPDIESESPFRESQMIIAAWGTGMFTADELRAPLASRVRVPLAEGSTAPSDVMVPNTAGALKAAADAAPKPVVVAAPGGAAPAGGKPAASAGSANGQGKNALGVGKVTDNKASNAARNKGEVSAGK